MIQVQKKHQPSSLVAPFAAAISANSAVPQSLVTKRLLKISSVLERVPVSRTEWYRRIKKGTAPAPLSLSVNSVAWLESDIDAFIDGLPKLGAK